MVVALDNNYRKVMNHLVLPHFGNKFMDAITSLDIERFINELKCGSNTRQNKLTPFRFVMTLAEKHGIIQSNSFVDLDPIKNVRIAEASGLKWKRCATDKLCPAAGRSYHNADDGGPLLSAQPRPG